MDADERGYVKRALNSWYDHRNAAFRLPRRELRLMLQRKRCDPFSRAAYVGGDIKMHPAKLAFEACGLTPLYFPNSLTLHGVSRFGFADRILFTSSAETLSAFWPKSLRT